MNNTQLEKRNVAKPSLDGRWSHYYGTGSENTRIHYVRQGQGTPVLLLHGWPGFWFDWRKVIPQLSVSADVIAPDFRGFGDSDKPDLPAAEGYNPQVLAKDILALLDFLKINKVIVSAHDIGATVAQTIVRMAPERVSSLVLLNPPYPGIGARRYDRSIQGEFWYQQLHNLPWADDFIGHNRSTIKQYLTHFYTHWLGKKDALLQDELEWIIDVYSLPGAIKGSLQYYRARSGARNKEAALDPKTLQINHKTTVLWGEKDPVMLSEWSDQLDLYFTNMELKLLQGIGHFVPFEASEAVIDAILEHINGSEFCRANFIMRM
jgi:pimeloyl-ACP methyl ester carboxylesterase